MQRPASDRSAGERHVHLLLSKAQSLDLRMQIGAAPRQGPLDCLAHLIGDGADSWPVLRRQGADAAQDRREFALLAEILDLERVEIGRVRCGPYLLECPLLQASQISAQAFEVHAALSLLTSGPGPPQSLLRRI